MANNIDQKKLREAQYNLIISFLLAEPGTQITILKILQQIFPKETGKIYKDFIEKDNLIVKAFVQPNLKVVGGPLFGLKPFKVLQDQKMVEDVLKGLDKLNISPDLKEISDKFYQQPVD